MITKRSSHMPTLTNIAVMKRPSGLVRFVIIPTSLSRDFLPSSWGMYHGTIWDWAMYLGSMGLFLFLLALFIRFLPMISIFEMRTMLPGAEPHPEGQEP